MRKFFTEGYIVRNSRIPKFLSLFFSIGAVTIGPFIFIAPGQDSPRLIRHERIHVQQGLHLLYVGLFVLYSLFWVFALLRTRDPYTAYRSVPFEREAYAKEWELNYKSSLFAWAKYLF